MEPVTARSREVQRQGRKARGGGGRAAAEKGAGKGKRKGRTGARVAMEEGRDGGKGRVRARAAAGGIKGQTQGKQQQGRQQQHTRSLRGGGPGAGKGPAGKGKRGEAGRHGKHGRRPEAEARGRGIGNQPQEKASGEALRAEIQPVRCNTPGIQHMPAHHAHHHIPSPLYSIDPSLGALVPNQHAHHPNPAPAARAASRAGKNGRRPGRARLPGGTNAYGCRVWLHRSLRRNR